MSCSIPLTRGAVALVDDDDYAALNAYRWRLNSKGYAIRSFTVNDREIVVCMHRQLLSAPPHLVVDHIDNDKLNNTRANLRLCTHAQNQANRRLPLSSTTGFKGVNFQHGKWHASIMVEGVSIHMGFYDDLLTAALMYDYAARRLYGEFAHPNLPDQAIPDDVVVQVERYLAAYGSGTGSKR